MVENIEKMEQQIAEKEKELQNLKRKVAELKSEEDSAFEPKNILIEEIDISPYIENILYNKGIVSLEKILKMSDDEVYSFEKENNLYFLTELRNNWNSGNKEEIIEYVKKIRFATNILQKQGMKLFEVGKIFRHFRRFGRNEALFFGNVKGNLNIIDNHCKKFIYMYSKGFKIYLYNVCKSCEKGNFPAMKALLDADECTIDLVKAVILEDINETIKWVDKNSNEYVNLSNICEAIKKFK